MDRWTAAQGLASQSFTTVGEIQGSIWAGAGSELIRLQIDAQTEEARMAGRYGKAEGFDAGEGVAGVCFWRGRIWAATARGLIRQLPFGRWEFVDLEPSLSALPLEALAADALGNLWLGSDGGGAARISGAGLSSFTERAGLAIRKVAAIFEGRKGELMVVTKKDDGRLFLNQFDGRRFHPVRANAPSGTVWGSSWAKWLHLYSTGSVALGGERLNFTLAFQGHLE